eukprot:2301793-Rhodomonas_salina.1
MVLGAGSRSRWQVPSSAYNNFTNFEKQFWDIKKTHFDVVLFFKKGKVRSGSHEQRLVLERVCGVTAVGFGTVAALLCSSFRLSRWRKGFDFCGSADV